MKIGFDEVGNFCTGCGKRFATRHGVIGHLRSCKGRNGGVVIAGQFPAQPAQQSLSALSALDAVAELANQGSPAPLSGAQLFLGPAQQTARPLLVTPAQANKLQLLLNPPPAPPSLFGSLLPSSQNGFPWLLAVGIGLALFLAFRVGGKGSLNVLDGLGTKALNEATSGVAKKMIKKALAEF